MSEERDPGKRSRLFEDIFIFVSILALWPVVLGLEGWIYELGLYTALAGLVYIFFRRMRRFRAAQRDIEDE